MYEQIIILSSDPCVFSDQLEISFHMEKIAPAFFSLMVNLVMKFNIWKETIHSGSDYAIHQLVFTDFDLEFAECVAKIWETYNADQYTDVVLTSTICRCPRWLSFHKDRCSHAHTLLLRIWNYHLGIRMEIFMCGQPSQPSRSRKPLHRLIRLSYIDICYNR